MENVSIKFTVFFEEPFWIGVFERNIDERLSVSKMVFGAEPKDYEVFEFILNNYYKLVFGPEIIVPKNLKDRINPKKAIKDIKKQVKSNGTGTKSQQALKLQQEQNKILRKVKSKEQKEFEKERMYSLKQQKKREKHKGR